MWCETMLYVWNKYLLIFNISRPRLVIECLNLSERNIHSIDCRYIKI
jgi:hypothetical protein